MLFLFAFCYDVRKDVHSMLLYSLIFGLAAWVLACLAAKKEHTAVLVSGSFICCCVSAVVEFIDIKGRVFRGDIIGVEDTIEAVIFGVILMMVVTVLLNFMALIIKTDKHSAQ